jgi:hypothetical protein
MAPEKATMTKEERAKQVEATTEKAVAAQNPMGSPGTATSPTAAPAPKK